MNEYNNCCQAPTWTLVRLWPLGLQPYLIQGTNLEFRSTDSKDTNPQSSKLQPVFAKHRLGLPRLQPCQFWGTNLKDSNPISASGTDLVSWGLWSSRAPTLFSKAPTLLFEAPTSWHQPSGLQPTLVLCPDVFDSISLLPISSSLSPANVQVH